jgi:glycosyltransferase involved in cell wall biosynthesis
MSKFFEYKEDKKVVTILRLRNSHKYTGKNLQHTMDSFYYLLDLFIQNNPQFEYRYYNLSIRNIKKRPRNLIDIKESDYLIIPTEMEFVYHLDTAPFILKRKTDEWIKGINEVLNDGKIRKAIILTSDKLDTIELLSTTLPSPNIEWYRIDENDFIGGIHNLKHEFICEETFDKNKDIDFSYWGVMHKKDDRKDLMNTIRKDNDITKILIGWDVKGVKKYKDGMKEHLNDIGRSRTTICLNVSPKGFTSRYGEALACGTIPLVWKDYDIDNEIVGCLWQRCNTYEELKQKIIQLRDDKFFHKMYNEILKGYKERVMDKKYYIDTFDTLIKEVIDEKE